MAYTFKQYMAVKRRVDNEYRQLKLTLAKHQAKGRTEDCYNIQREMDRLWAISNRIKTAFNLKY